MSRWASALLLLLVLGASRPADAQGIDDVPLPSEIGEVDQATAVLQIESPADGDTVKTPFTVTGTSAPGARLEIWIGDSLERVFLADANGRFNTAVSRAGSGPIRVHYVNAKGDRLQSAEITVVWAGSAATLAGQDVETESPVDDADAASLDPFGKQSSPSTGLPKVSDLDGDLGAGVPPVPPSPDEDPFAQPEPESADADVSATPPVTIYRPPPSRAVRSIAEAGGGVAGSLAFGFVGLLVGTGLGFAVDPQGFGPLIGAGFGGLAGLAVGLPAGVVFIGSILDGNGKWYAVVLGEALGFLGGLGITAACYGCSAGGVTLIALTVGGAVAGYELTSDHSASATRRGRQAILPQIVPTGDGGYTAGVSLRF